VDIEMLGIKGPWSGELEYQRAYIARGTVNGVSQGKNLSFSGFHAQASYVLTGQGRSLKKSNGTLNKPGLNGRPAWEASARYSFITLNDEDINGGRAYNTTASLSWYANNNIRVIGEYVYSLQRRQFATYLDKRHVSGLGARLQLVF
jgi:phosphate-selective porin OprO/OprP